MVWKPHSCENTLSAALRRARPEAGGVLSWELTRRCHQASGSGIKLLPQISAYMGRSWSWQPLPPSHTGNHTRGTLRALWANVHAACAYVRMGVYIYVCTYVYIHICVDTCVCARYVCMHMLCICMPMCIHTAWIKLLGVRNHSCEVDGDYRML